MKIDLFIVYNLLVMGGLIVAGAIKLRKARREARREADARLERHRRHLRLTRPLGQPTVDPLRLGEGAKCYAECAIRASHVPPCGDCELCAFGQG